MEHGGLLMGIAQVLYIIVWTQFAVLHMLWAQVLAAWFGWPQCGGECKQTLDFVFFNFFHKLQPTS